MNETKDGVMTEAGVGQLLTPDYLLVVVRKFLNVFKFSQISNLHILLRIRIFLIEVKYLFTGALVENLKRVDIFESKATL